MIKHAVNSLRSYSADPRLSGYPVYFRNQIIHTIDWRYSVNLNNKILWHNLKTNKNIQNCDNQFAYPVHNVYFQFFLSNKLLIHIILHATFFLPYYKQIMFRCSRYHCHGWNEFELIYLPSFSGHVLLALGPNSSFACNLKLWIVILRLRYLIMDKFANHAKDISGLARSNENEQISYFW